MWIRLALVATGVDPEAVCYAEGEFLAHQAAALNRVLPLEQAIPLLRAAARIPAEEAGEPIEPGAPRLSPKARAKRARGPTRLEVGKKYLGPGSKPGTRRVSHTAGLVRPDRVEAFVKMWESMGLLTDLRRVEAEKVAAALGAQPQEPEPPTG